MAVGFQALCDLPRYDCKTLGGGVVVDSWRRPSGELLPLFQICIKGLLVGEATTFRTIQNIAIRLHFLELGIDLKIDSFRQDVRKAGFASLLGYGSIFLAIAAYAVELDLVPGLVA